MTEEKKTTHAGGDNKDVEENKVIAAIGYLWILFLVPLLAKKDSPFAQYHAKQGLVLFVIWIISNFLWIIPVIGWVLSPIINLVIFVFVILGLVNALGGKKQPLPLIGKYAEDLKL